MIHKIAASCLLLLLATNNSLAAERNYALEQAAIRQSTAQAAESVVQIRTVGGFERIGETQISQGPTTGLIVSDDGYIVSSAFNFAQRPSSILVSLPNGKQVAAQLVARDSNRMLVLLKIETDQELIVPTFVPEREIAVGQWAVALGRTFQNDKVDTSLGIVSGLNRMHGRAIQTDCNVSAANYGGPLVDIRGRVFGLLVPMSPQAAGDGPESEVAGAEFYDSGIGFAVPLEHVFSVLERWKSGEDLLPGKLGVGMKSGSPYVEPPTVVSVWPGSPAALAGWKPQDTIIAAEGKAVQTQNQLQFYLKPKYAGDKLTVSMRRGSGDKAEEFDTEITLAGKLAPYRHSFLGVLPKADGGDDKEGGVIVEGIWPASPAAKAGLKTGDRIDKLGETKTPTFATAFEAMKGFQPEEKIDLAITRDEKEVTLEATLSALPNEILSQVDLEQSPAAVASETRELETMKLPQFSQEAKYSAPEKKYSAPGLITWLVENEAEEQALLKQWQAVCDRDGLVLLFAHPAKKEGWEFDDLEYLDELTRTARSRFKADPQRTVIVGSGKAGQLAYALGLRRRDNFGGVIADNAPLPRTMKVPENSPGAQVAILAVLPKNSSFAPLVKHDVEQLRAAGFPVSVVERAAVQSDSPSPDAAAQAAIARWIAGLRRF